MTPNSWQSTGKPELKVEEDLLFWCARGVVEADEMARIGTACKAVAVHCGYYILICDSREANGMSAAARRVNAAFNKGNPELLGVTIVFGASAMTRVIAGLLVRGMYLLSLMQVRVVFVQDAAEATAVAEVERRRLQTEVSSRRGTPSSLL